VNWFQNLIDQFKFVFVEGDRYQQIANWSKKHFTDYSRCFSNWYVIGVVIASIRSSFDKNKESLKMRGGIGYYILAVLNAICRVYLTIIRGTPVVVQLMIAYFIVFVSAKDGVPVGMLAFGINSGAYVAEPLIVQ